ncbi:MAG: hypothetical protein RLZZ599_1210, partial [Bacteroidota bacterium]
MEDGLQFNLPKNRSSVIKVIGVGGGGSNAVNHMKNVGVNGVDFIVCNTDAQALYHSPVSNKVQLGASLTEGLGAGADPEIGKNAAIESIAEIQSMLETGTKMCFVTAGMGGGTGTGAAPIIARASREMGILTVGIVTSPFSFEGKIRGAQAEQGIQEMREATDSLIVINNDKLRQVYGDLGFRNAFSKADEVLAGAAKGIAEVITNHYTQNIDLRDAKTVLENSGSALFGTGSGEGSDRATEAITAALDSPLLNDNHIKGAKNVLLLLTSGSGANEITIDEIGEITDHIQREAGGNANVIMGIGGAEEEGSRITCTIIATGFPTGTRVLPTDKIQVVKYDLEDQSAAPAVSAIVEQPKAVERIIMALEDTVEEPQLATEEPISEVPSTMEALEDEGPIAEFEAEDSLELETEIEGEPALETTYEAAPSFEDVEDPMMGFPQMPEAGIDERFEDSIGESVEVAADEEPMVHVLEWDLEDEDDEAHESIVSAEEASILAHHEEDVEEELDLDAATELEVTSATVPPQAKPASTLMGGWDLFSGYEEAEEEEMELTFHDDQDETVAIAEEPMAEVLAETVEEAQVFDAPMPAVESSATMEEEIQEVAMPLTREEPIFEAEANTFVLDDIDGDGFTLEMDELESSPRSESFSSDLEERDYDPFEMSLSEMPALKSKADQESVDQSFKLPSSEFDVEAEFKISVT